MNRYGNDAFFDLTIEDVTDDEITPAKAESLPRKALLQNVLGGGALAWVTTACVWTLYSNLAGSDPAVHDFATRFAALKTDAGQSIAVMKRAAKPAVSASTALLDPAYSLGRPPGTFSETIDQRRQFALATSRDAEPTGSLGAPSAVRQFEQKLAQNVPLPIARHAVRAVPAPAPSTAPAERPTILEKLFGDFQQHASGPRLAYAAPDGGVTSSGLPTWSGSVKAVAGDEFTAVYDISARTVYLPDGTRLEAHSGLGAKMDDPRYVHMKMQGATPPHTYDLTLRESLFHGVQALRLNPVGGDEAIHGRKGLLAHSYLLGPNGDSNGCVSFKNYDAFLQAYRDQKLKRLVVVARL